MVGETARRDVVFCKLLKGDAIPIHTSVDTVTWALLLPHRS